MTDAASPFLNRPLRIESEAKAACEQTERERRRRLREHGADFCRRILDGAFQRVYQVDGHYRLRDLATDAWFDDRQSSRAENPVTVQANRELLETSTIALTTAAILAARHDGYRIALRDMAQWISSAALDQRLNADTLSALNAHIAILTGRITTAVGGSPELG